MRIEAAVLTVTTLALAACSAPAPSAAPAASFNAEDPVVVAILDSMVALAREGANAANADLALGALNPVDDVTFLTGDILLTGKENILIAFRATYSQIQRQRYAPIGRIVRLIAPDIAIYSGIGKGTFQDSDGYVMEPVWLGASCVFAKKDGAWRLVHFHQAVQP